MSDSLDHDQTDKIIESYCVIGESESEKSQQLQDSLMLAGSGSGESLVTCIKHQVARLTSDLKKVEKNQVDEPLRKNFFELVQQVTTLTGEQDKMKKDLQDTNIKINDMEVDINSIKEHVYTDLSPQISSQIAEAMSNHVLDEGQLKQIETHLSNSILAKLSTQIHTIVQEKVKCELQSIQQKQVTSDILTSDTQPILEAAPPSSDHYNANTSISNLRNQEVNKAALPPLLRRRSSSLTISRPRSYSYDSDYSSHRGSIEVPTSPPPRSSSNQALPEEQIDV